MSDQDIRELAEAAEQWRPPEGAPLAPLAYGTDIEIVERVLADIEERYGPVVYCDGAFWQYDATHWRAIEQPKLRVAVHRYDRVPYGSKGKFVGLSKNRIDSVLNEMRAKREDTEFFARRPPGINCASGFITFDLVDGTAGLAPHDRDHRCRHVLPGKWYGTSIDWKLKLLFGSLLGQFLNGIFRGDEDAEQKEMLLQEMAGAVALGYGTNLRRPKAIILAGATAENGKSQVLDLFRGLLPPDAVVSVPAAKLGDERYVPLLAGKHLNAADELSGANAIASDAFKSVVTGEPVTGREVYRTAVTVRPVALNVFCTNALPSFAGGMDRGVQRRLIVLQFNRVIPVEERVGHIGQRIGDEEADLLLAWAVEGASRLIQKHEFTVPKSSEAALKQWLNTADPVIAWAEAQVMAIEPGSPEWQRAKMKSRHAYAHFKHFAEAEGYNKDRLPAVNGFVQRLIAHLPTIQSKHTNKGNWLVGIRIEDYDPEADSRDFEGLECREGRVKTE